MAHLLSRLCGAPGPWRRGWAGLRECINHRHHLGPKPRQLRQLCVDFGEAAILPEPGATGNPYPTNIDLTPVGIAATGMELQVSRLLLERDVYYRVAHPPNNTGDLGSLTQALHDPAKWASFKKRYLAELKANPDAVATLRTLARKGKVTLVYAAKDPTHNQAAALIAYLKR